ncbi:MAG: Lon protease family protein [Promethearchaeota archaeon]
MQKLDARQLRARCKVREFACKTSAELSTLEGVVGQPRALNAMQFGLEIPDKGFNIYVAGMPGTGRSTAIERFLKELAATKPVPSDWCYVTNYANQFIPKALEFPAGMGKVFASKVDRFIEASRTSIQQMLESEEYAKQREEQTQIFEAQRDQLTEEMRSKAQEAGFVLQGTQTGLLMVPIIKGQPLTPDMVAQLKPEVRKEIESRRSTLETELRATFRKLRNLERELREQLRQMEEKAVRFTLEPLITELEEEYQGNDKAVKWVHELSDDLIENLNQFIGRQPEGLPPIMAARIPSPEDFAQRYKVNLIVDNSEQDGAPIVFVSNATYTNLFGRVEKEPRFGALVTDTTMIRAGDLHRANGGYLVIPVREMLMNPVSYPALKRALQNDQVGMEEVSEVMGFLTVKTLHPEPIPLKLKVILLGEPMWYQQLYQLDPDFRELFKVKADFDTTMDRNQDSVRIYGDFVCTLTEKESLLPLTVQAIAEVVDFSSRLADSKDKLSTRFDVVSDVIRESNFYAKKEGKKEIGLSHIKKTIDERYFRSSLYAEKIREYIKKGVVLIDTEGDVVGQINGLSVLSLGDFTFGQPSRITATVAPGRGQVIDIEREAQLSGPLQIKGVQILTGFLHKTFGQDKPLSLSARITFEQSYGGVDGDSASSTELYAMLSALSEVPIQQRFAVTGSVNQNGHVQAIGGVNQKIEGYFAVCKEIGLTGEQGVLVPKSNVQNLMLKDEVIEAVESGKFHIFSVETIEEGIELLTGKPAGKRQADGKFPLDSIFGRVDKRLREMANIMREHNRPDVGN